MVGLHDGSMAYWKSPACDDHHSANLQLLQQRMDWCGQTGMKSLLSLQASHSVSVTGLLQKLRLHIVVILIDNGFACIAVSK